MPDGWRINGKTENERRADGQTRNGQTNEERTNKWRKGGQTDNGKMKDNAFKLDFHCIRVITRLLYKVRRQCQVKVQVLTCVQKMYILEKSYFKD